MIDSPAWCRKGYKRRNRREYGTLWSISLKAHSSYFTGSQIRNTRDELADLTGPVISLLIGGFVSKAKPYVPDTLFRLGSRAFGKVLRVLPRSGFGELRPVFRAER